jgi:hypothetical protein
MLHRGIAAGLAVVGLCLGPAVLASTALAQEQPSAQVFQTWRTTTLGTYKSVDAYRRALDSARIRIGDAADEILGRPVFPYTRTKTVVELAVLSAAELGVESDESSLADVYERARRAGLELCPPEVGPQLRLDYRNQPLGEALDIAMEPVATYSGDPTPILVDNVRPNSYAIKSQRLGYESGPVDGVQCRLVNVQIGPTLISLDK